MATLPRFTAESALTPVGMIRIGPYYDDVPLEVSCDPPCPEGTECTRQVIPAQKYPIGICCPPGRVGCLGKCYEPCPGKQSRFSDCGCRCRGAWVDDPFFGPISVFQDCGPVRVWNPIECRCDCRADPCPDYRMVRNPNKACVCECPAPLTDCYGYCADLTDDPLFCGSCDATPCDSFSEKCCNGTCTNVCVGSPCGDCTRALQADENCCNCTPRKRGSPQNCTGKCDSCTGGRTCITDPATGLSSCQCPSGTRECHPSRPCCPDARDCCSNGDCCPTGTTCCPPGTGNCVNTNVDVDNCGGCDKRCPQGAACVSRQCKCPTNQIVCFQAPAQPPSPQNPGRCVDNMTPSPAAPWTAPWRAAHGSEPFFTCPINPAGYSQLVCAPSLALISPQNGGPTCCPQGYTKIVNGLCSN
jgi:hypothetical protein